MDWIALPSIVAFACLAFVAALLAPSFARVGKEVNRRYGLAGFLRWQARGCSSALDAPTVRVGILNAIEDMERMSPHFRGSHPLASRLAFSTTCADRYIVRLGYASTYTVRVVRPSPGSFGRVLVKRHFPLLYLGPILAPLFLGWPALGVLSFVAAFTIDPDVFAALIADHVAQVSDLPGSAAANLQPVE